MKITNEDLNECMIIGVITLNVLLLIICVIYLLCQINLMKLITLIGILISLFIVSVLFTYLIFLLGVFIKRIYRFIMKKTTR